MKKVTIVIPTYWTWPSDQDNKKEVYNFDHPTPLDGKGTLGRLLFSLKNLEYKNFDVLIISSAAHDKLKEKVEAKVDLIVDQYNNDLPIKHFSYSDLPDLKEKIKNKIEDKFLEEINLDNYPNIRNIQLLVPYMQGTEIVIGIDDDEIIEDNMYLEKAVQYAGERREGDYIAGVAGYYTDIKGSQYLQENKNPDNLFEKKNKLMNDTYKKLESTDKRLVRTPFILGGNMIIPSKTIERIPFDPYNSRGEDIDYLINAGLEGYNFYFDKRLKVVHLPPSYGKKQTEVAKLKSDIYRFLYEKKKIEIAKDKKGFKKLDIEELSPYPGEFLTGSIEKAASNMLCKTFKDLHIENPRAKAENYIGKAVDKADKLAPTYFNFNKSWKDLLSSL